MTEILNIGDKPIFDDRTVKIETHTYNPYANITFGYSDEIRIPIQQQDLYTLPCESFLYVEGKLTIKKPAANKHVVLENNCVAYIGYSKGRGNNTLYKYWGTHRLLCSVV
ncbi:uncharacterized protein LOC113562130 [Ooceraea biroi]|uniref:uncharacterized protein LOC113562130 n=1 Tax=Ooceraea biroi TaxID=2015173 RepID=UPI000F09184F|nr:uncharacterized protein LOC113562130 [Ooceraea biroi]